MEVSRSILALFVCSSVSAPLLGQASFQRADSNADGTLNVSDPIHLLNFLFLGGPAPPCLDAADANDDGVLNVSDAPWVLSFLFLDGAPPREPFPGCGTDPTADGLGCELYSPCPQEPILPHPDPDPCAQIGGPCESAVIGPYTLVSVPDGTGILTTATHREGDVILLMWDPVSDDALDLTLSLPAGPSLDPFRIGAGLPTLRGANVLAGLVLVLNTSETVGVNALAAAPAPSGNHAGCDPNEWMGLFDCSPCGGCCDLHDVCIHQNCTGPNDSGDLRECALRGLRHLDCLLGPEPETCDERFPVCSSRCSQCHLRVVACFAICIRFPGLGPGASNCCGRGDCGLPQQCIVNGVVETSADRCPDPESTAWGDPHLITFDRLAYDFQGVGEFILTRSPVAGLEVQSRMAPWRSSRHVSVTKAVAMNVGGDRVGVYLDRSPPLYVNGAPVVLGAEPFALPGGGQIQAGGGAYTVLWPDGSQARVVLRADYLDLNFRLSSDRGISLEGLLGNFDGLRENDLTSRTGVVLGSRPSIQELYSEYGESWRITQAESLFEYFDGDTTESHTDRRFPDSVASANDLSPDARALAEQACAAAGVTDPILLEACILDVGFTGEVSFAESAGDVAPPGGSVDPPPCGQSLVTWVDWTSGNATAAEGGANGVTVSFAGALNPPPLLGGEGNFWNTSSATYTKPGIVDTPPGTSDLIRLVGGAGTGTQTLTFSSPVVDPVMAIFSLGQPNSPTTYEFDAPFDLLSSGPGYFGNGILTQLDGDVLQGREGYGLIQFHGVVSSISWTMPTPETWHGFQVGLIECR